MIDYEKMMAAPEFQSLEPERVESFLAAIKKIEGKSTIESLAIMTDFMKKMPKGRPLSKHEQAAMIKVMMESLPDQERVKFSQMLAFMGGADKR